MGEPKCQWILCAASGKGEEGQVHWIKLAETKWAHLGFVWLIAAFAGKNWTLGGMRIPQGIWRDA